MYKFIGELWSNHTARLAYWHNGYKFWKYSQVHNSVTSYFCKMFTGLHVTCCIVLCFLVSIYTYLESCFNEGLFGHPFLPDERYLGCYTDSRERPCPPWLASVRLLPVYTKISQMTSVWKLCRSVSGADYAFAGVEYGNECYCGMFMVPTSVDSVSGQIVIANIGVLEACMKVAVEMVLLLYLIVSFLYICLVM